MPLQAIMFSLCPVVPMPRANISIFSLRMNTKSDFDEIWGGRDDFCKKVNV